MHWSIDVDVRTPWQDPILRIGYDYVFTPTAVSVRTRVRSFCAKPTCGDAPHQHFAKEPKFTVQVAPAAGDAIAVYDEAGVELTRWPGGHPRKGTGQVGRRIARQRRVHRVRPERRRAGSERPLGRLGLRAGRSGRSPPPATRLPRARRTARHRPLRERKGHALGLQRGVPGRRAASGNGSSSAALPASRWPPSSTAGREAWGTTTASRRPGTSRRRARSSRTTSSTRSRQTAVTAPASSRRSFTNSASSMRPA